MGRPDRLRFCTSTARHSSRGVSSAEKSRSLDAGSLDERPEPPGRGVVDGQRHVPEPAEQGLDHREHEGGGDRLGLLAGGDDGRGARAELLTQPGGADSGGAGPPTAVERPPRNKRASRGADRRSRAEAGRVNHWQRAGSGCEDVMVGSDRGDRLAWEPPSSRTGRPSSTQPFLSPKGGAR